MTIYFANENGDWWEYDPKFAIFVLDTEDLPLSAIVGHDTSEDTEEELIEMGLLNKDGTKNMDDWYPDEDVIFEYGKPILQEKILDLL